MNYTKTILTILMLTMILTLSGCVGKDISDAKVGDNINDYRIDTHGKTPASDTSIGKIRNISWKNIGGYDQYAEVFFQTPDGPRLIKVMAWKDGKQGSLSAQVNSDLITTVYTW